MNGEQIAFLVTGYGLGLATGFLVWLKHLLSPERRAILDETRQALSDLENTFKRIRSEGEPLTDKQIEDIEKLHKENQHHG